MNNNLIFAGTGHRPGSTTFDYSDETFKVLTETIKEKLAEYNNISKIISGMAIGFDMALAQSAIELNIPLVAAIPFKGQESVWPIKTQNKYKNLLSKSEKIVIVSAGGFSKQKMQIRNCWMIDNCDIVLALWNGNEGGTGNCIKYANQKNKEIINIWENFKNKMEK